MRRLSHSPAEAVAFLRKRLAPVLAPDGKRVQALLADLDSDVLATRDRASAELAKLSDAAAEACRKALADRPSPEKRRRLERLLKPLDAEVSHPPPQRLRLARCLEVLERIDSPQARGVLTALAGGAAGAWLTQEAKEAAARLSRR